MLLMLTLAGTKDNVTQTGTVNLHFLIPGTSEPISATVSILVLASQVVFLVLSVTRRRPPLCQVLIGTESCNLYCSL